MPLAMLINWFGLTFLIAGFVWSIWHISSCDKVHWSAVALLFFERCCDGGIRIHKLRTMTWSIGLSLLGLPLLIIGSIFLILGLGRTETWAFAVGVTLLIFGILLQVLAALLK